MRFGMFGRGWFASVGPVGMIFLLPVFVLWACLVLCYYMAVFGVALAVALAKGVEFVVQSRRK